MSDTKIKTSNIGNLAVTHALLHTDMDLTSKTVQVATPTSNTHPATKAYVDTEVANLIDSAPGTLDTLNELAAAVNDDANFNATIASSIATKLPLAGGTMTGNLQIYKAEPIITLQRSNNALLPGISWQGSGGAEAASIKLDGTSGATNTLIMSTYNGSTMAERLRLMTNAAGGIAVTGTISVTGTVDGVDIAARDAVLTSTTTTADAALPKAGGTLTGTVNLVDNVAFRLGSDDDFRIWFDGTDTNFRNFFHAGGDVRFSGEGSDGISDDALILDFSGTRSYVRLMENGQERVKTTSTGIDVTGIAKATDTSANAVTYAIVTDNSGASGTTVAGLGFANGGALKSSITAAVYGNDYMTFNVGGSGTTERMRIDSSGNVGIGTGSSTLSAKLVVSGPNVIFHDNGGSTLRFNKTLGTDTAFIANRSYNFHDGNGLAIATQDSNPIRFATNNTERMRIDSSGNVGINASDPQGSIHVRRTGTASLILEGDTNNSGDTGQRDVEILMLTDGGAGNDPFGGTTYGAHGYRISTQNHSGKTSLSFDEWHSSLGFLSRFHIDEDGKVGIGTTDPQDKLHISGVSENIRVHNTGTGNYGLEIWRGSNKGASFAWGEGNANLEIKNYRNDSQPDGPYANIDFFTGGTNANSSGSPAYSPELRMRIQQTGEVGIGTSNPTAELHVVGDATVTGNITKGSGVKYEPEYQGYVLTNDNDYKLLARISSGSGYCGACEFNLAGTTNSTVFQTVGVASANHSYDGSILTHVTSHYSGVKIKIVSNGNNEFELYVAVNTAGSNNVGISYTIRKVNGNVTMAPSSAAYSSGYLVHTAGNNTITTSASMPSGSGPTAF
jgi:hypothetical protein